MRALVESGAISKWLSYPGYGGWLYLLEKNESQTDFRLQYNKLSNAWAACSDLNDYQASRTQSVIGRLATFIAGAERDWTMAHRAADLLRAVVDTATRRDAKELLGDGLYSLGCALLAKSIYEITNRRALRPSTVCGKPYLNGVKHGHPISTYIKERSMVELSRR